MLKKIALLIISIFAVGSLITTTPAMAIGGGIDGRGCNYFLGMPSWDCNVDIESIKSTDAIGIGIATIISNILTDLSVIAAYLIVGYIIYGGYLYMLSGGDAAKVSSAKKTLTNAFIGLGITILANVIFTAIRVAITGNATLPSEDCLTNECVSGNNLFQNLFNWAVGIVGVVAVIFVVYGGVLYMTSRGDAAKVKKAKETILYSIIGLIIVALSLVISSFAFNLLNSAGESAYLITNIKGVL